MSGAKLEVLWSPIHHDKFILWGPDITLYEVSRIKEIEKKTTFTPISSTRGATVLASQSASGVSCVDISAIPEQPEPLLALGYASGRVALTTLKQTYDPLGLVGREFTCRYPRLCNSVSWSHMETNLLAVAMEKNRNDHCILLWDVYRGSLLSEEAKASDASPSAATESPRPMAEMGLSETAHCVTWANFSSRTLIASMNLKYIKIFDLRDLSNKAVTMTTTKYCYGICAEPCGGYQIASRGEGVACVWDARALQKPLLTIQHPRPLAQLQWCPTRRNLLVSLQRDSTTLRIHDIQQANSDNKLNVSDSTSSQTAAPAVEAELEEQCPRGPSVLERDVALGAAPAPLLGYGWHPAHEGRLLAVCASGALVDYTVCERVTVSWGGGGSLVWTGGGGALRMMRDDFYAAIQDISFVMKKRAQTDYGLKPDLWQNADLADDDALSGLWHFLALSKSLVEDGCIRNSPWKHPGVRTVLRSVGDGGYRSEIVPSLLPDLPNRRVTIYRSAERTRALQLCGWGWGWENALAGVERAEAEGTPCRAAALAAFQLRVRAALDVLARAHEPMLRVVALALAGTSAAVIWSGIHCVAHNRITWMI